MIPRLSIADRCSFNDRRLIVNGKLHSYRIHLGSGNVLIDNGHYLCIVRTPENTAPIFLPFEGDAMTSLVLSKAVLLANDDKIKDPSILSQL